jgi:uroporphyrinogen decarboxylase
VLVGNCGGVICMPGPDNYEDFCFALLEEPEKIEAQARQTLQRGLENARRYRAAGADVAQTSSDLADNRGPFFSPPQMDRLILPFLRQWAADIRALGMYALLHTDGNVNPILADLADSGIPGLQGIDPIAGMDLPIAKQRVAGRCCLCGNIDPGLLLLGRPEEIYEKCRTLLDTGKAGGGLIFGSANAVFEQTPRENYLALVAAWREYGTF